MRGFAALRAVAASVLLMCALVVPATTVAAELRSGDAVIIGPDEVIEDDLYVSASTVTVQGTVRGDVLAMAQTVTVTGTVAGNLHAAAATVEIPGTIERSVRAAAGTITVSGRVAGDLVAAAGTINVAPGARVGRDALVAAGQSELDGRIERRLWAAGDEVELLGSVGSDAKVTAETLRLGPAAAIAGNLEYSAEESTVPGDAKIQGRVERRGHVPSAGARFAAGVLGWLRALVGLFLLGLILVLLFPVTARRSRETLETRPAGSFGFGALLAFAVPIASVLVIVLGAFIGGWWIGLFLLALYAIALALGLPVAGLTLGEWVARRTGRRMHPLLALFIGLLALTLVSQVPILGPVIAFAAVLFGLGALFLAVFRAHPTSVVQPAAHAS